MEDNQAPNKKNTWFILPALFLVGLLLILFFLLINDIRLVNKTGAFNQRQSLSEILLRHKRTSRISITDANYIDEWMTFRYLNFIFKIPENYFKDKLSIKNPRYPNITLSKYIKSEHLSERQFLERVKGMISEYLLTNPIK